MTGLNLVLQQPLTAVLATTKVDIAKKNYILLLLVLLPARSSNVKGKGGLLISFILTLLYIASNQNYEIPRTSWNSARS